MNVHKTDSMNGRSSFKTSKKIMSGISSYLSQRSSFSRGLNASESGVSDGVNTNSSSSRHYESSNHRSNWRDRGGSRGRGRGNYQSSSSFRGRGRGRYHSSSSGHRDDYQKSRVFNDDHHNHQDLYGMEEKDERASAEEEALALKLLEQEESLQTAGSELFIPVEQEYDMFCKKVINWKNDSHSISQQVSDGEQLKQFRSYDVEATEQCKKMLQQISKPTTTDVSTINTLTVSSDSLLTSAYRDVVKKIQEEVSQGQSKHYAKLDKTILHYEDILYSLMKVPKLTCIPSHSSQFQHTSDNSSESTSCTQFEKFKNIFERKQRERRELKDFPNFADNLFEKCTELFNIAEEAPVCEIENDADVQKAIQQVIDSTRKTTVYQKTNGPYDYGTLLQALLDFMGRKSKHQTSQSSRDKMRHSERSKYQSISTGDEEEESFHNNESVLSKRKRENESNESDNEEDNEESSEENEEETSEHETEEHEQASQITQSEFTKCKTTIELLGDRYKLLPQIHKWHSLLNLSMGANGIDFHIDLKTSFKKRQKQIRHDLSVAQRPDWKHKEATQVAVLASSSTPLSRSILSSSNKCLDVVHHSLL